LLYFTGVSGYRSAAMAAFWFLIVAAAVSASGLVLARASDRLGEAFKLERSMTGFLMLAAATSLPELVVSCQVARTGAVDMAVGSLLGSCLMNLLILAGIDLTRRTGGRILSAKAAAHALASLSSVLLAGCVVFSVLVDTPAIYGRIDGGSVLILVAYVLTFRLVYVDRRVATTQEIVDIDEETLAATATLPRPSKWKPGVLYGVSTLGIFVLAGPLASTSNELAEMLQLSGTFFGAVFLALVTSLPEVVTTAEASRMGADDLAIGNILGSNSFNLLILFAVDVVYGAPLFSALSMIHATVALGIIITTTLATMGLLYRVERRLWFLEPDALAVIATALLFFYLLYRST